MKNKINRYIVALLMVGTLMSLLSSSNSYDSSSIYSYATIYTSYGELVGNAEKCVFNGTFQKDGKLSQRHCDQLNYQVKYLAPAIENRLLTGIPISITLAQGILESGAGKSYLAREGNNHFGIKTWSKKVPHIVLHDDGPNDMFRKFPSVLDSYLEHSKILMKDRYRKAFKHDVTDYKGWAKAIHDAGYATSATYSNKLIKLIKDWNISHWDHYSDDELKALLPVIKQMAP